MRHIKLPLVGVLLASGSYPALADCSGQFRGGTLCGNPTGALGLPGPTATPVLGVPGTTRGTLTFSGLSSGAPVIAPQSAAGTATLLLPTLNGTFPSTASPPLTIDPVTGLVTCTTCLTTGSSFANPTAVVGFSAVNGTATTVMRSDAAPALSTSIYSTVSIATTLAERDANQNAFANSFVSKATNVVSANSTTVLTVASNPYQNLTGALPQVFQLPDATTLQVGTPYQFSDNSTGTLTVTNSSGTILATVPAGGFASVQNISTASSSGSWDFHFWAPSNVHWGTAGLSIGTNGSSTGTLSLLGSTSGTATITPQAAAGSPTLILPTASGTFAVSASAPLALNSTTGALSVTGSTGTVLGGATPAFTATPTLGTNGGTGGQITFNGSTSGSVALRVPAAAGTATVFQLPSSNGTSGYLLQTDGAGQLSYVVAGVSSITPGAGLVSSITTACSQTAIATSGTLSKAECINAQTGTTYAFVDGDRAKLVTASNTAAQAYSLPQAGATSAFQSGWYVDLCNLSTNVAGIVTVTPTTSTIGGASSLKIQPAGSLSPMCVRIVSDGTNYQVANNVTGDQLPGTTTNDNANSGNVGEYISSTVAAGSAVSISNGVAANVTTVSLTAGDWDVFGQLFINPAGGTITTLLIGSTGVTTATLSSPPDFVLGYTSTGTGIGSPLTSRRYSFTTTTTVYMVVDANFSGGTNTAYGTLSARRRR